MANDYGLGRGLASLIPNKKAASNQKHGNEDDATEKDDPVRRNDEMNDKKNDQVTEIEIEKIVPNPHQPRFEFNEIKLEELSNSIKNHGIIQPLIVSKNNGQYELIAGERRFQAAKIAGLEKVPIVVRDAGEKEKLELAVVENIHRHDLNPVEEAKAYRKLHDEFKMSQEEVALRVGKSRSAVANKMRLLNLPVEIQKALIEGRITEGHAKAIISIENSEKQRAIFDLIIKNNLTVRQVEDKGKEISVKTHKRVVNADPALKEIENKLMGVFGTRVKVTKSGGGGKIIVDYYSEEELDGILGKISNI